MRYTNPRTLLFTRNGVAGTHLHAKFTVVALKMWAYDPKIAKKYNFGANLPVGENPVGPQRNLNIGAQLETFLYATVP